jgi:hypothetical protein
VGRDEQRDKQYGARDRFAHEAAVAGQHENRQRRNGYSSQRNGHLRRALLPRNGKQSARNGGPLPELSTLPARNSRS